MGVALGALGLLALASPVAGQYPTQPRADVIGPTPPAVRHYVSYRTSTPVTVDGRLSEAAWRSAEWTAAFTDIEGDVRPAPRYRTRAKILWDSRFLYLGAELEEPGLWATVTRRDAVIFHDHDFEVFLDPDGDTHAYFELEINALGTVWDLFLPRPYRDGGQADNGWDMTGLRSAVALRGTLNDPTDRDTAWSVELAIPWTALAPPGRTGRPPSDGDQWRINFSRVEWDLVVADGRYAKRLDSATGKPAPERNWVWSPQHAINMHLPELWGVVQFTSGAPAPGAEGGFREPSDEEGRWALRRVYYAQAAYRVARGRYARNTRELGLGDPAAASVTVSATDTTFTASAVGSSGATWRIRHDGRTWR